MADASPKPPAITSFTFTHQALRLPGSFFTLMPGTREAVLKIAYGDVRGTVPLRGVMSTFNIAADSEDGRMLTLVEGALRHVPEIRHGDKVPTEIVDGTASWPLEPRHKALAMLRVGTTLAALGGTVSGDADVDDVEATRRRLANLAQAVVDKFPSGGLTPQDIAERAERIANEFAFVEALRAFWRPVLDMPYTMREVERANSRDRDVGADAKSIATLLKVPIKMIQGQLDKADGVLADMVGAIDNIDATVKAIRRVRDALHFESLAWGDLPARWKELRARDERILQAMVELRRFLGPRYTQTKAWAGVG